MVLGYRLLTTKFMFDFVDPSGETLQSFKIAISLVCIKHSQYFYNTYPGASSCNKYLLRYLFLSIYGVLEQSVICPMYILNYLLSRNNQRLQRSSLHAKKSFIKIVHDNQNGNVPLYTPNKKSAIYKQYTSFKRLKILILPHRVYYNTYRINFQD